MEFKQNKFLPAEKQIITANPDVTTVRMLPAIFTIQISQGMAKLKLYHKIPTFILSELSIDLISLLLKIGLKF